MNHTFSSRNHYKILSLPSVFASGQAPTLDAIKKAYHRALLVNHPDKSNSALTPPRAKYTVDEITVAYQVLSDPVLRSSFDRSLRLNFETSPTARNLTGAVPTGETVDLDDMKYDDEQKLWYRGCRCGHEKGFVVTEDDLEKRAAEAEVLIGCQGCSLVIKILFVAQDES